MKSKKLLVYRLLFISWSITILVLTSLPKLKTPAAGILAFDKLAHFFVYLVFAWLYVKISRQEFPQMFRTLMLLALIIPFADELHQIPIPGREFSIFDVIADMLGFLVILILLRQRLIKPIEP